jgi:glycosyltransferase involved in cell wall biosynthesis
MSDYFTFSIIIPHKNTPELLRRCLASIPRCEDIQIIIVDDNSDSAKVDFEHFPGLGEAHTEVYLTKEGKGAGYARNIGLNHAKGTWLLFADADDFFTENAFETLFKYIDSSHDIIYFKTRSCYSDTYEPAKRDERFNQFIDDFIKHDKDAKNMMRYKWQVPWGKMIKRELLIRKNIKFDEVIASNDAMFSLLIGNFAASIGGINHILYCVTVNRGSLTNSMSRDILMSRYTVSLRCNEFRRQHGVEKYQSSIVLYYLLSSIKYGINTFYQCLKLAFQYKMNPFFGIYNGIKKYISFNRDMKHKQKYIVKK